MSFACDVVVEASFLVVSFDEELEEVLAIA